MIIGQELKHIRVKWYSRGEFEVIRLYIRLHCKGLAPEPFVYGVTLDGLRHRAELYDLDWNPAFPSLD
jgi:hypothetical protein